MNQTFSAVCPECRNRLSLQRQPQIGQLTMCHACGELLLVVGRNPLVFSLAHADEEEHNPSLHPAQRPRRRFNGRAPRVSPRDFREE